MELILDPQQLRGSTSTAIGEFHWTKLQDRNVGNILGEKEIKNHGVKIMSNFFKICSNLELKNKQKIFHQIENLTWQRKIWY